MKSDEEIKSAVESSTKNFVISIAADLQEVRKVSAWLHQVAEDCLVGTEVISKIELALAEVCNNIIAHGYGQVPSGGFIELVAQVSDASLMVTITDEAPEFTFEPAGEFDFSEPKVHGYGLMIVQSLTDTFSVSRLQNQNVWNLTFRLDPVAK